MAEQMTAEQRVEELNVVFEHWKFGAQTVKNATAKAMQAHADAAVAKVEEENRKLREALEFYADEAVYATHVKGFSGTIYKEAEVVDDGGQRARAALGKKD